MHCVYPTSILASPRGEAGRLAPTVAAIVVDVEVAVVIAAVPEVAAGYAAVPKCERDFFSKPEQTNACGTIPCPCHSQTYTF